VDLLQIHSELNVCNFVTVRSDLAFLSYVIYGVTFFPDTVYIHKISVTHAPRSRKRTISLAAKGRCPRCRKKPSSTSTESSIRVEPKHFWALLSFVSILYKMTCACHILTLHKDHMTASVTC